MTKLGDRIPVEPLDDLRLTNIERSIVLGATGTQAARPVPASARFGVGWAIAAAAATAMAAGVVGWKLHAHPRGGEADLAISTRPVTMQTSTASSTLDIGDAIIASDAGTQFAITRPDGKVLVTMTRGRVELEVAKRAERPPLIVHAGDTDVIVVGTHFSVDFDGTGDVGVHVTEGIVRVERKRQAVRLTAGQAWSATRGVVAMAQFPEPAGSVHLDASGHIAAAAEPTVGGLALDGTVGSAGYAIDTSDVPDVLKNRTAVVPDPNPVPHRAHKSTTDGGSNAGVVAATDTVPTQAADPHADVKALIRSRPLLPAQDVGTVTGEAAMAKYRETSTREKGTDAAYALYSMAVTQHLKLGRNADALSTIDAFVRRFNGGDYYEPVLWLRVRVLCLRAIDDKCRGAAQVYLSRAPSGPMASVAELITMTGEP